MPVKKKLLIFSTQLMDTGGIESHIKEFISKMGGTNLYELDLVVLRTQMSNYQKETLSNSCNRVCLLSGKGVKEKLSFLWAIIKSAFIKYDALYTNGQGDSIAFIKKIFRYKKWVHHHHTSGDFADQETWSRNYRQALTEADVVVACSQKNAKDMSKALGKEIITIPCFSRKIDISLTGSKPDGKVHLGYYGRLIPEKGIDLLCKLSDDKDLKDIQFHIWGEGSKYDKSFFLQYPKMLYHGHFNGLEELRYVLENIDGYLLLSVHPEGLPISLLELMSAGLPWMSTNKGGISDIACDPEATRLIESLEPYGVLKESIKLFAEDISQGKIDPENQKKLYNEKFESSVLIKSWHTTLFNTLK